MILDMADSPRLPTPGRDGASVLTSGDSSGSLLSTVGVAPDAMSTAGKCGFRLGNEARSRTLEAEIPARAPFWMKAHRVGWQVEFAPAQLPTANHRRTPWRGAFLDVSSLGHALDGDRSASFSEHRVNFGLNPTVLPVS